MTLSRFVSLLSQAVDNKWQDISLDTVQTLALVQARLKQWT